jgi:hypothetical protein
MEMNGNELFFLMWDDLQQFIKLYKINIAQMVNKYLDKQMYRLKCHNKHLDNKCIAMGDDFIEGIFFTIVCCDCKHEYYGHECMICGIKSIHKSYYFHSYRDITICYYCNNLFREQQFMNRLRTNRFKNIQSKFFSLYLDSITKMEAKTVRVINSDFPVSIWSANKYSMYCVHKSHLYFGIENVIRFIINIWNRRARQSNNNYIMEAKIIADYLDLINFEISSLLSDLIIFSSKTQKINGH